MEQVNRPHIGAVGLPQKVACAPYLHVAVADAVPHLLREPCGPGKDLIRVIALQGHDVDSRERIRQIDSICGKHELRRP